MWVMIPVGDRPDRDYTYRSDPHQRELKRLTGEPDPEVFALWGAREMQAHLRRNLASYPLQAVDVRVRVWNHHERETLTLTMDEPTAALVMFAVRALMIEYQAHAREVRLYGETLEPDTWGRKNREEIASRLERHIARLSMVDDAYREEVRREFWGM